MSVGFRFLIIAVSLGVSACSNGRLMPQAMMPEPPKQCEEVLNFEVKPLPNGKSNAAVLSAAMAKEGAIRQQEHATARVCAEYALRTADTMRDKDAPSSAKAGVEAATVVPSRSTAPPATPAKPQPAAIKPIAML